MWAYGIQVWGTTAASNLKVIQVSQNKFLRKLTGCAIYCYVDVIHENANIDFVADYVKKLNIRYLERLETHPNFLALNLLDNSETPRRLRRKHVLDLQHN